MPYVGGKWQPEDDSSVTKLNAITSTDSPTMQLARATAAETANGRGLMNSSIAAGAGEAASIAAAAPFALQDANNTAQKNISYQDAGQSADLSRQQAEQALSAQQEAEGAQSRLSTQEYGQQTGLLGVQSQAAKDLAAQQAASTKDLANVNNDAEMKRTAATLASTERGTATAALGNNEAAYLDAFGKIAQNPDIPAASRDAYLSNILAIRTQGNDAVQQMYGISLNWGGGGGAGDGTGTGAPAPTQAVPEPANDGGGKTKTDKILNVVSPITNLVGTSGVKKVLAGGGLLGAFL
jgi:hypothetical protein